MCRMKLILIIHKGVNFKTSIDNNVYIKLCLLGHPDLISLKNFTENSDSNFINYIWSLSKMELQSLIAANKSIDIEVYRMTENGYQYILGYGRLKICNSQYLWLLNKEQVKIKWITLTDPHNGVDEELKFQYSFVYCSDSYFNQIVNEKAELPSTPDSSILTKGDVFQFNIPNIDKAISDAMESGTLTSNEASCAPIISTKTTMTMSQFKSLRRKGVFKTKHDFVPIESYPKRQKRNKLGKQNFYKFDKFEQHCPDTILDPKTEATSPRVRVKNAEKIKRRLSFEDDDPVLKVDKDKEQKTFCRQLYCMKRTLRFPSSSSSSDSS